MQQESEWIDHKSESDDNDSYTFVTWDYPGSFDIGYDHSAQYFIYHSLIIDISNQDE